MEELRESNNNNGFFSCVRWLDPLWDLKMCPVEHVAFIRVVYKVVMPNLPPRLEAPFFPQTQICFIWLLEYMKESSVSKQSIAEFHKF